MCLWEPTSGGSSGYLSTVLFIAKHVVLNDFNSIQANIDNVFAKYLKGAIVTRYIHTNIHT